MHFGIEIPLYEEDAPCAVTCRILEEEGSGNGYARYTVNITELDGQKTDLCATLECTYAATCHIGDTVVLSAIVSLPEKVYSQEEYLYSVANGIRLHVLSEQESQMTVLGGEKTAFREFFSHLRANLASRMLRLVGKRNGGLAITLFLGDRTYLNTEITTHFRRSGVSHLLALSGMHVSILLGIFASVGTKVRVPKRIRLILLAILLIGYLALTDFRISAIRAAGMVLLMYLAEFSGQQNDPLTSLCFVGFMMLAVSPSTVADAGFWMSFSAVFGLVTILPYFNEWLKCKNISHVLSTVCASLVASVTAIVAVVFISWIFSGEFTLMGIPLTVILSPVLSLILMLIPAVLLLDALPFFSATPVAFPLRLLLELMGRLTAKVSEIPRVSVSLQTPYAGWILGVMTAVLLLLLCLPLKRKLWLVLPPVLALAVFCTTTFMWYHTTFGTQVTAAYVVRGSGSALIVNDYGSVTVIDTSAGSDAVMREAQRAYEKMAATEVDFLILTHCHRAHVTSVTKLAKRTALHRIYVPMPKSDEDYLVLSALYDRLAPLGTDILCYGPKDALQLTSQVVFTPVASPSIARSTHPIVSYMVQTPSQIVTFAHPSIQETDAFSTFRWITERSDILIFGEDGPVIKHPMTLFEIGKSTRLILTDGTDALTSLVGTLSGSDAPCVITDITCYKFSIPK